MTLLTDLKSVQRETAAQYRRRALVVRLKPRTIEIREKGRRDVLVVDYLTLYDFAMTLWARTGTVRPRVLSRSWRRRLGEWGAALPGGARPNPPARTLWVLRRWTARRARFCSTCSGRGFARRSRLDHDPPAR